MAEPTPTNHDKALIDTLNTLKKLIKNPAQAAFAVNQIAKMYDDILTKLETSQQIKDVQQDAASPSKPQQSAPVPLHGKADSSTSHNPAPKYSPALNERLPATLRDTVGEYQNANLIVLNDLIKYGGFNHRPDSDRPDQLDFLDAWGDVCTMKVEREFMYGRNETIPHIRASHYGALLDSICNLYETREKPNAQQKPSAQQKFREMSASLNSAIEGRTAVHKWHLALPPGDPRLDDNAKYAAFSETLEALKERMKFWS